MKMPSRLEPNKEEGYLGLAWMIAAFSFIPETQSGSVIVGEQGNILAIGYNHVPDDKMIEDNNDYIWYNKDIITSIQHAIQNYTHKENDAHLYTTHYPTTKCMFEIVKSGIKNVTYFKDIPEKAEAIAEIAVETNIHIKQYKNTSVTNMLWMRDWLMHLKYFGIFDI